MTNSEAIAVLMEQKRYVHENSVPDQALDIGIKALKNERKKGKWIKHEPFDKGHKNCNVCIECSVCGIWFGYDCYARTNYCPNCGADMRGEGKKP